MSDIAIKADGLSKHYRLGGASHQHNAAAVSADEGMWPPSQLPSIEAQLKARGLELDAKDLSSLTDYPLNAIVGLGYCTGSFLSPNGLVATNHHSGFGIVQFNSTKEKNLMVDGFLAKDVAAELPADPNQRLYVTEAITHISARLTGASTASAA